MSEQQVFCKECFEIEGKKREPTFRMFDFGTTLEEFPVCDKFEKHNVENEYFIDGESVLFFHLREEDLITK